MNKVYPDFNGDLRNGNIEIFLEIVVDNYLKILELNKKKKSRFELLKSETPENFSDFSEIHKKKLYEISRSGNIDFKLTLQSIIILCTFFEGLINEIGIIGLGQKYFKENLERLSIISKFEIILKLVYNKSLNRESQYYENIKLLIKNRNGLVHYKSTKVAGDTIDDLAESLMKHHNYFEILNKNIDSLEALFNDLKTIDNEKGILDYYDIQNEIIRIKNCT